MTDIQEGGKGQKKGHFYFLCTVDLDDGPL